jgi:hypothetical protein
MLKVANSVINASQIATPITFAGDVTLSTGNLVIGTSGKGIDFSATGQPAGMTSELLADYEEGTWTPTPVSITVVTGTPVYTGRYTKIGRQVTIDINMTGLSGTITIPSGASFTGLPYTSGTNSWGVYGNYGAATTGGFCIMSSGGTTLYLSTAGTYANYFSLTIEYSV